MVGVDAETSDARALRRCPRCGRATDADLARCPNCLADITHAAVLEAEEATRAVEADRADDVRRARRRRRRSLREVWTRRAAVIGVVALAGWWVYSNFIYEPPPVPAASVPGIAMRSAPETWPVEGGTAGGARVADVPAFLDGSIRWSVNLRTAVKTSMVTDGTRLFVTTNDNRILALDAATGEQRWAALLQNAPFAAPTIAGDRLYVALLSGALAAYRVDDGTLLWEVDGPRGNFQSAPLVADGVVYVFGTSGVFGFDADTGALIWDRPHDNTWGTTTPVMEGDYVIAATGGEVKVLHRRLGVQTYFLEFARSAPMSVVIDQGQVFAVYRRTASAFDVTESRPWWDPFRQIWSQAWIIGWAPPIQPPPTIWSAGEAPAESHPAVLAGDRLLITGRRGELLALDRATGATLWTATTPNVVAPPVLTRDGLLLMHRSSLSVVDPATGAVVAVQEMPDELLTRFTVTALGLFIATEDGTVSLRR